jgi:hypothetical protein
MTGPTDGTAPSVVQVLDGPRVALAREVGGPSPRTTLLYRGESPVSVVLGQFLDVTGIEPGDVAWAAG